MSRFPTMDERAARIDRRAQLRTEREALRQSRNDRRRWAESAKIRAWKNRLVTLASRRGCSRGSRRIMHSAEDRLRLVLDRVRRSGPWSEQKHDDGCSCYDCLWGRNGKLARSV